MNSTSESIRIRRCRVANHSFCIEASSVAITLEADIWKRHAVEDGLGCWTKLTGPGGEVPVCDLGKCLGIRPGEQNRDLVAAVLHSMPTPWAMLVDHVSDVQIVPVHCLRKFRDNSGESRGDRFLKGWIPFNVKTLHPISDPEVDASLVMHSWMIETDKLCVSGIVDDQNLINRFQALSVSAIHDS